MTQAGFAFDDQTHVLTQLELFNWGGFQGRHQAIIDGAGTAVIGPTGSGKTTLVDALMTLLCANPRYNLASTGGHESDRDLVSYVRGISGPGDGGAAQSHIARQGKTITAISATLASQEHTVRLGALFWFDDSSSAATDMKRLWLFAVSPEQTIEHWLMLHHEGGMRALRQQEKQSTGIWVYPSKKAFLARLRDYFDVGENAFTLLNRAAGLKQLNSIDDIFRELVLDDHSAFDRAAEVANSFDDLTEIHQELETARRQQRSLQPIATAWQRYQTLQQELSEKQEISRLMPVWFAEQAYRLWRAEADRLSDAHGHAEQTQQQLQIELTQHRKRVDDLRQAYLQIGGASIDDLNDRIGDWQKNCGSRQLAADQYQRLVRNLGLSEDLRAEVLDANKREARTRLDILEQEIKAAENNAYRQGADEQAIKTELEQLKTEEAEVIKRPGSNLPAQFQTFRTALAEQLNLPEADLPFVAELVQIKADQQSWRGAIERALGSHRLRVLVPPASAKEALRWVNARDNRLHVRLLEVKEPEKTPRFFDDGYTRKLDFKQHPYREAVKALLADNDRHCVSSPDQLRETPHAMTAQGLMSGKARFFDKQDQKRLHEDWMTGFDNKDRLAFLRTEISRVTEELNQATQAFEQAKGVVTTLQGQAKALEQLLSIVFDTIDLPGAERELKQLQRKLAALSQPDSDLAAAKNALQQAQNEQTQLEEQHKAAIGDAARVKKDLEWAETSKLRAFKVCESGMTNAERELAGSHLPTIAVRQLVDIHDIERDYRDRVQEAVKSLSTAVADTVQNLTKLMSDAKKEDTGALAEVGRDLEDIPQYLERLNVLTEEALPEKLKRFLDYLNRSSDEGVTQLLSHVENEVSIIEERLEDLNSTMRRVDFQPGQYLRLVAKKVVHESLRSLQRAQRALNSARLTDDAGESHYKALKELVLLLKDACERSRTQGAQALLDPRYRLEFAVSVIDRVSGQVVETRTGSQGGSGGEKEIIASYVLTASLSYALCPDGSSRPLFGTIVLDEAFSRSSHAVAGRIIAALCEFGLHAVFITPNKEMRLLRHHTRSAIVVHRRGVSSSLTSLSWEELEAHKQSRAANRHEIAD
ncbi:MAG: hypothetical protein CMK70_07240 [Pseudohongiella sp.]|nr:hypothetical protein [Pseudohongiella sp.]|tara:strand:+ start:3916 stop:7221 length:3306 start_codon:yes stop_codon:yes gene_type:complete